MFKTISMAALLAFSFNFNAMADSDLTLPGERWLAAGTGYLCSDYTAASAVPAVLEQFGVQFEQLTTDRSLDNGLVKASFVENGVTCHYSVILFADNALKTIQLVRSHAYALDSSTTCEEGKAAIDELLTFNDYLYWKDRSQTNDSGRPLTHVTIMAPVADAAELCGEGATTVGIDFTVRGLISAD